MNSVLLAGLMLAVGAVEAPYAFRQTLETVHEKGCRNPQAVVAADEFAFTDGCAIADADLADFLRSSMEVKVADGGTGKNLAEAVTTSINPSLREREYEITVTPSGVRLSAADARTMRRAFYRLEDRMRLRCGPFLKIGSERRRALFAPRMTHSAWDVDVFPDAYLNRIAHGGFDSIMIFVKGPNETRNCKGADIADIIRRAKRFGLETYLYSYVQAFVHPDDPRAPEIFASTYGKLAAAANEAKGIIFVGESCEFPSKDKRTTGLSYRMPRPESEKRPNPGWFPCTDYPDWLNAVKAAIRKEAPKMEVVFWTYNWGWAPEADRIALIERLPKDITLMATFEMFEKATRRNGLVTTCDDYSLSLPTAGRYFLSEAAAAKRCGLPFYGMTNTSGLSWDLGTVPYEPFPQLWNERYQSVLDSERRFGLRGLMENHTMAWTPNFVSEIENELFTEGGVGFEEILHAIAVRDFGEKNAAKAISAWEKWSVAAHDMVPSNINQYGPLRVGPAYPYNFFGPHISKSEVPQTKGRTGMQFCQLNYEEEMDFTRDSNGKLRSPDRDFEAKEIELFADMVKAFDEGAASFEQIASEVTWVTHREKAEKMAILGRYWAASMRTLTNVKRGYLAYLDGNRAEVKRIGIEELANARSALKLVERDSRLGFEAAGGYVGGPEQIRWKIDRLERHLKCFP